MSQTIQVEFIVDDVQAYTAGTYAKASDLANQKFIEGKVTYVDNFLKLIKILVVSTNINFDTDTLENYQNWVFELISPVGEIGDTGVQGETGYTGSQGQSGYFLGVGYTGSRGSVGYRGSSGSQGEVGYTGSQGGTGYIGSSGSSSINSITISSVSSYIDNKNVTHSNVGLAGGTIKILGSQYTSPLEALVGNAFVSSANITVINSGNVLVRVPPNVPGRQRILLVNNQGQFAVNVSGVNYINSLGPVWVTEAELPSQSIGSTIDLKLVATNAASYLLRSSLPQNLILYSNGNLVGKISSDIEANYSFTAGAVDSQDIENQKTFYLQYRRYNQKIIANPFGTGFTIKDIVNAKINNIHYRIMAGQRNNFFQGNIAVSNDGGEYWTIKYNTSYIPGRLGPEQPDVITSADEMSPVVIVTKVNLPGGFDVSSDLNTWTPVSVTNWIKSYSTASGDPYWLSLKNDFISIVYSPSRQLFVAIGRWCHIAYSKNGYSWTFSTSLFSLWGNSVDHPLLTNLDGTKYKVPLGFGAGLTVGTRGIIWAHGGNIYGRPYFAPQVSKSDREPRLAWTENGYSWVNVNLFDNSIYETGELRRWSSSEIVAIVLTNTSSVGNTTLIIGDSGKSIFYRIASGKWQSPSNWDQIRIQISVTGTLNITKSWVSSEGVFYVLTSDQFLLYSSDNGASWNYLSMKDRVNRLTDKKYIADVVRPIMANPTDIPSYTTAQNYIYLTNDNELIIDSTDLRPPE